ncbi:hypothetical protein Tco_0366593 [Tanacetum coccineum]
MMTKMRCLVRMGLTGIVPLEFISRVNLSFENHMKVDGRTKKCMTRSSTKELFTPFKEKEREFRSSRKLLKTLSPDESRSPKFNLFSDLEEYSKEEVMKTMAETMKQYMRKTRADYRLGISRPKIDDKDSLELKGQFLKELCDNTFSGSDHRDENEHIENILYSKGAIPSKTTADEKVAIQEMADYSQKWHNGTSRIRSTKTYDGLVAIQAQLNNLGREIKKVKSSSRILPEEQCKPFVLRTKAIYGRNPDLRERMERDLEARLMGETLVLNRSLDHLYGDYIELNDLNVPLELKRDQVDDLMPTIKEGEWWKIYMATKIKTWEILFLENRSAKIHVWKQKGPRCKEIDEFGEVSIIWNPMCDSSHAGI